MKIYDVNLSGTGATESGRAQEVQRTGRDGSTGAIANAGGSGDHIEFSGTLGSLERAMSAYSSDRSAKVQALAAQYRSGTYQVDSKATSRAMVTAALAEGR